ncbi:hypothetical protein AVEN_100227-1 [Araneus ventricosus]|uniref:Uncharacterized protein n=1 Tax=Araneus ventricosus TaxID=182803 RepID=A0A4Y2UAY6_ARAVE|nr:hypothetical protein AVEN_100227-1 [Araneus ventricosus]
MTTATPQTAPLLQIFAQHQREDISPRHIKRAPDPFTRRLFDGPKPREAMKPRSYHQATATHIYCYKDVMSLSCLASLIVVEGVLQGGRGGLVVKSRLWGRRVPGSKPDSTGDPSRMRPIARQIIRSGQTPSCWCGVVVWRGGASSGVGLVI